MQNTFHRLFKIFDFKKEYQLKSSGLNFLQLHILEKLWEEGAMKTLDISKAMDISPSTLIGILDELERQKLILRERQQSDKRVVLVTVTSIGEEIVKQHFQEDEIFLINLLKQLDTQEQEELVRLMDKMTGSITELEKLFKQ